MLRIVNMIPRALSGETNQDSEPNIAVDPENPRHIVATAFTPDPASGPRAPVFVSNDGGSTWQLRTIVPGGSSTHDISVSFASRGGTLYAGILEEVNSHLNVLRSADPFSSAPMTVLIDRDDEDQPWVSAATVIGGNEAGQDRVYVGHNNTGARPRSASVELSLNARIAAAPAGFATHQVERRDPVGQDGPPTRTAVHSDGTVYAAFQHYNALTSVGTNVWDGNFNVIVVRDDDWSRGNNPFSALTDNGGVAGIAVATNQFFRFTTTTGPLGQERIGADLAIAVDPRDSDVVFVAWANRVGGSTGTDWTIHARRSTDRGRTWSGDRRTITNAKNPALAVNSRGLLGFLYQQLVGTGTTARWVTQLELTDDAWATPARTMVLHTALASAPARRGLPYLGDYARLLALDDSFYGVFSGSNLPDSDNFPSGVVFQRNADWTTHTLLGVDNATAVAVSIDPFFIIHQSGEPLLQFFKEPAQPWQVFDTPSSDTGGTLIAGDPVLDSQPGQALSIYARAQDGRLLQFFKEPAQPWQVFDTPSSDTGGTLIAGDPVLDSQPGQALSIYARGA
jgi:hypothetical protein